MGASVPQARRLTGFYIFRKRSSGEFLIDLLHLIGESVFGNIPRDSRLGSQVGLNLANRPIDITGSLPGLHHSTYPVTQM